MQNHNKSRKNGFTLAEVLITLGVIGVVAALTLPSVISNYKEREYIVKLQKAYSTITQAFTAAIADYGTVDNWCERPVNGDQCSANFQEILSKYLSVSKKCVAGDGKCFAKQYYNSDTKQKAGLNIVKSVLVNDGMSYGWNAQPGDNYVNNWCKTTTNDLGSGGFYNNCGSIFVDLNGPIRPNELGRDVFKFKIYQNGVRPGGIPADTVWLESFKDQCLAQNPSNSDSKVWCTGWVIINDNMDYWHCNDLDWNTKTSCKKK